MKLPLTTAWRRTFEPAVLARDHAPLPLPLRKRRVAEAVGPPGRSTVPLVASRWMTGALPVELSPSSSTRVVVVDGWFRYPAAVEPGVHDWHLNFASASAFSTYALPLLAQDEMQVLEHPILMSLREALCAAGDRPDTITRDGAPTPVLVRGVEHSCILDTAPNKREGRPHGLYGNAFAAADSEAILRAVHRLDPPTLSNILAIEAPSYGAGPYRGDEIEGILRTAWAGFAAAARESADAEGATVTIHTGYWGCGAYGGDRVLMTLLQVVAARCAGIERLVFHAGNDDTDAREGVALAEECLQQATDGSITVESLVLWILDRGFEWGKSDGN